MASEITGAQALVNALEDSGVDVMFGIPGGAILPAYDPIFDSKIRQRPLRSLQYNKALPSGEKLSRVSCSGVAVILLVTPPSTLVTNTSPR